MKLFIDAVFKVLLVVLAIVLLAGVLVLTAVMVDVPPALFLAFVCMIGGGVVVGVAVDIVWTISKERKNERD